MKIAIFFFAVKRAVKCDRETVAEKPTIMAIYISAGVVLLLSILFLPFLCKYLVGLRKICLIMQHICSVLFLSSQVAMINVAPTKSLEVTTAFLGYRENVKPIKSLHDSIALRDYLPEFVRSVLYNQLDYLALICSYDIYQLICYPFLYKEFSERKNVIKILAIATCFSMVMGCEVIVVWICEIIWGKSSSYSAKEFILGTTCFRVVKTTLERIAFFIFAWSMAKKVKKVLRESVQFSNNQGRRELFQGLYHFMLIPMFLSFFRLLYEIFLLCVPFKMILESCLTNVWAYETVSCLLIALFTMSSFTYPLGYVILVPHIKKAFLCKKSTVIV